MEIWHNLLTLYTLNPSCPLSNHPSIYTSIPQCIINTSILGNHDCTQAPSYNWGNIITMYNKAIHSGKKIINSTKHTDIDNMCLYIQPNKVSFRWTGKCQFSSSQISKEILEWWTNILTPSPVGAYGWILGWWWWG